MVRRAHARACQRGRGSERARKKDLDPVRLFTGYKYRSRTGTQMEHGVVQQCAQFSFSGPFIVLHCSLHPEVPHAWG